MNLTEHKSCVDFLDGVCAKNKDCSLSLDVRLTSGFIWIKAIVPFPAQVNL